MISDDNIKELDRIKLKRRIDITTPWVICILSFILNYCLGIKYDENINLFNDKLIDVSALFFGVFVGSLYLFDKFNDRPFYSNLIKFSKKLIALNILIIIMSFIIILYNESFSTVLSLPIKGKIYNIDTSLVLFSLYVSISAVTVYFMVRYIKVLFLLLGDYVKKS
ncbi:hypothetical protein HX024_17835 [Myroides marinus]|uniref:hypothetical protein n=1 Tax=Myroides marinus TaxID=703342 RepID=UPI002574E569|nr:hypothetical protein [Myroides marinus]MDM1384523.1 hypothetical protein [Myroides marinus]